MYKKKLLITSFLVILALVLGIFLHGFTTAPADLRIHIEYDGEVLLSDVYHMEWEDKIKYFLLYNGSLSEFFGDNGGDYGFVCKVFPRLANDLDSLVKKIDMPPVDATVNLDSTTQQFVFTIEKDGKKVDYKRLLYDIFNNTDGSISLKVDTLPPAVTKIDLIARTRLISKFSTSYATSSNNRKHNIALAASFLQGYTLLSGEEFSFNRVIGLRTAERGFCEANIISKGEFVKGIGGGVCQVSTTLYNAALLAGLKITKVTNHSLPISYVPMSFDAMVSSAQDFTFVNDTPYPIFIKTFNNNNNLVFEFFGKPLQDFIISRRSVILKIIDGDYETIKEIADCEGESIIKEPKSGYITEGYLDYYSGEVLVKSQKVRADVYKPTKGIKIKYVLPSLDSLGR